MGRGSNRPRARWGATGRRVIVLTGNGEMLMGIGDLATIAVQPRPAGNLCHRQPALRRNRYGNHRLRCRSCRDGGGCGVCAYRNGVDQNVGQRSASLGGPVFVDIKVNTDYADGAADARRYCHSRPSGSCLVTGHSIKQIDQMT